MPSSVQLFNNAISQFKNLQGQLIEKQGKISADSIASTFAELGDDLPVVLSFQLSIDRSTRYVSSIKEAGRKNDVLFQSLQQLIDVATQFKQNLAVENSSGTAELNNINQLGDAALGNIRGALNLKDGASFVFAGSKTNIEPVSDLTTSSNLDGITPTASYYNGDDFKASLDVSSSLTIEYGITAGDEAFQNLIGSINLAQDAETSGSQNLTQAGELLDTAIDQLIALQAKIGDNARLFESSIGFHETAKASFQEKFNDVNSPDIIQLTLETTQLQATLSASFSAFAKISSLSLINFL